ncbi:MAG: type II toxin-antitoxin system VapC family toxin [Thermodesulfobacteriota bacterium]|nr:type II toxin-antitoxin system VapC family toxin [Thermodesulfobacteriota bacterium]
MKTFFDASAFAKRYVEEPGSQLVDDICLNAKEVSISVICVPEIISALNRRVREKSLSRQNYATIKQHLSDDVRDAVIVNLIPEVIVTSTKLLETSPLRAMDALHVACALVWGAELFVSSDKRQITSAKKAGLKIKFV